MTKLCAKDAGCAGKKITDKKCSWVRGRLAEDYVCPRYCDQAQLIDYRPVTQVDVDGTLLDMESNFCCLGDMLCAGGGCKLAIVTRWITAWGSLKGFFLFWHPSMCPLGPAGKSSKSVYVLPYYMRLRWFGHVALSSSCINSITSMTIPSARRRGRPKKTWSECVKADMKMCSLGSINPLNRAELG